MLTTAEILGYVGMAFIATSFFFSNIKILRILNLVGAIAMAVYGIMIDELPVAILNVLIAVVNIYYINKMLTAKTRFDLSSVNYEKGGVFDKFYQAYETDIQHFFPGFELNELDSAKIDLILRDFKVVGCFIYRKTGDQVNILVDYVEPNARDMENSRYLYAIKKSDFKANGVMSLICKSSVAAHKNYLKNLGFGAEGDDKFVLSLN